MPNPASLPHPCTCVPARKTSLAKELNKFKHVFKIIWQVAALLLPLTAATQTLPQLQDCIRTTQGRSLAADLTALEYSQKGEWLKYLPNLGITYTVVGQPRPAVSTSTSVFYQANRDRKNRESARAAAQKRSLLQLDVNLAKLTRLWNRHQRTIQRYQAYDDIAQIDRDLFDLYEKQYAAKELLPEPFLLKKKAFLLQEIKRQEEQEKQQDLWSLILDTAGCLNSVPAPSNK
jgi:hypothetical protein